MHFSFTEHEKQLGTLLLSTKLFLLLNENKIINKQFFQPIFAGLHFLNTWKCL